MVHKSNWEKELGELLGAKSRRTRAESERARFADFLRQVVTPAFHRLRESLIKHGRVAVIRESPASTTMSVRYNEADEISIRVLLRSLPNDLVPYAEVRLRKGDRMVKNESYFSASDKPCGLDQVGQEDVIQCVLRNYRSSLETERE